MRNFNGELNIVTLGVKYCGGCDPKMDRISVFDEINRRLKNHVRWVPYSDPSAQAVLVICGCATACADVSDLDADQLLWISDPQDIQPALEAIDAIMP